MKKLAEYQTLLSQAQGRRSAYQTELDNSVSKLEEAGRELSYLDEAQAFLQRVAQETQSQLRYRIENIVQLALDSCFPGKYSFEVNFEIKRGRTEAELIFRKGNITVEPLESSGGGVADLTAFALRVAAWAIGKTRKTMVLDEPFRCLSSDLQPVAGEIVKQLSEKLGLQFIIVTHNNTMMNIADRTFQVANNNGISEVTQNA